MLGSTLRLCDNPLCIPKNKFSISTMGMPYPMDPQQPSDDTYALKRDYNASSRSVAATGGTHAAD